MMAPHLGSCWSQLLSEILDLVLQRLILSDCFSFGEVCKSWRSVFLDRRRLHRPPPFLILRPDRGSPPCLGLQSNQLVALRSFQPKFGEEESILGSSRGWLVIASSLKYNLHLLSLTSHKRIPLPSIDERISAVEYVVLSSVPTSDDCIFVAQGWVTDVPRVLAWCRLGDRSWSIITRPDSMKYIEEAMFHRGDLYVYEVDGDALIYTFKPHPTVTGRVSINSIGMNFNWIEMSLSRTLVESNEGLLLVMCGVIGSTQVIVVFKLAEERDNRWERVESLGEQVLLLGEYGRESICTIGLMGSSFEPNCIYQYPMNSMVLEKYCMADGSIEEISLPFDYDEDDGNRYLPEVEWIAAQSW